MAAPTELTREMGCTVAEFERWLPGATRNAPIESTGSSHRVTVEGGVVDIALTPLAPRKIALMVIPVLAVTFRFNGLNDQQRDAFLRYFDHYTRRGGG